MPAVRRPRLDVHFNWEDNPVNGHNILPDVTRQPEDDFCGPHAAVEAFESRARLMCARQGQVFPTLSIQHLIDLLKDQLASAKNAAQRKEVMEDENAFKILQVNGVTSKADYDAAPPGNGHVKNVQGLHHYKIDGYLQFYMRANAWNSSGYKKIIDTIAVDGPVYGWFIYDASFEDPRYRNRIYRGPRPGAAPRPVTAGRLPATHAMMLYGFGAQRRTGTFDYQNNWGAMFHRGGRGTMSSRNIQKVIVPIVGSNL